MITGSVQGVGHQIPDQFMVQPGSNYAQAHSTAGFTWTSSAFNESEDLGNISLGVMSNETIYMINVLDINFTQSGYFNLTVTVPYSNGVLLPTDSEIYFSTSPMTLSTSGISGNSGNSFGPVSLYAASPTGGVTVNFGHVTPSTHIYIGFVVGAGTPAIGSFNLAMSFTA